ncbi:MAG TPA: hypothetical protein VKY45_14370 [Marinilabiliaceae bacterium]|nr:hypothetical protein [Marinilabiliaceae bacterium]
MKLLTIAFYISLILIIAKCNSSAPPGSASKNKLDSQIESTKMIYFIEEFSADSNKAFFYDSTDQKIIIVSSMESDQPKTLDFLLGNKEPRPFLK